MDLTTALELFNLQSLQQIEKKDQLDALFRILAKKTHPDRGGTEGLFKLTMAAYKKIAAELRARDSLDHQALKSAANRRNKATAEGIPNQGMTQDKFQRYFEENRLSTPFDRGYGEMMAPSSALREDIDIPALKNKKEFAQRFEEQRPKNVQNQQQNKLMRYKPPEALQSTSSRSLGFTVLGQDHVDDFSGASEQKKLVFTDYKVAHESGYLITEDDRKRARQRSFRTVEDYERYRSEKTQRPLSQKQLTAQEELERQEKKRESRRMKNYQRELEQAEELERKMNRLLK